MKNADPRRFRPAMKTAAAIVYFSLTNRDLAGFCIQLNRLKTIQKSLGKFQRAAVLPTRTAINQKNFHKCPFLNHISIRSNRVNLRECRKTNAVGSKFNNNFVSAWIDPRLLLFERGSIQTSTLIYFMPLSVPVFRAIHNSRSITHAAPERNTLTIFSRIFWISDLRTVSILTGAASGYPAAPELIIFDGCRKFYGAAVA